MTTLDETQQIYARSTKCNLQVSRNETHVHKQTVQSVTLWDKKMHSYSSHEPYPADEKDHPVYNPKRVYCEECNVGSSKKINVKLYLVGYQYKYLCDTCMRYAHITTRSHCNQFNENKRENKLD